MVYDQKKRNKISKVPIFACIVCNMYMSAPLKRVPILLMGQTIMGHSVLVYLLCFINNHKHSMGDRGKVAPSMDPVTGACTSVNTVRL